jgi:hypothetical protein
MTYFHYVVAVGIIVFAVVASIVVALFLVKER